MSDQPERPTRLHPNKRIIKIEGCSDTFPTSFLVIIIAAFLFMGEPSIYESARVWIGKAAGTIPETYIWNPDN